MDLPEFAQAAFDGDLDKIKKLFAQGADINDAGKKGSPLILACQKNHAVVAEFLMEKGADLNLATSMGGTALNRASENGNVDLVEKLLANGAKIGPLALIVAAREGFSQVVEILVKAGSDIDAKQHWGQTALMLAAKNGHDDVVAFLLESGADPKLRDKSGATALGIALDNDEPEIAAMLKAKGAVEPEVKKKPISPAAVDEEEDDSDDGSEEVVPVEEAIDLGDEEIDLDDSDEEEDAKSRDDD